MSKPVFVITEQRDGVFIKVTYEVVSEGRRIADQLQTELITITLCSEVLDIAEQLGNYGADKVLVAESDIFINYTAEGYTKVITDIVRQIDPVGILLPATAIDKDLAPRVAAKLDIGLATDCIRLLISENGKIIACRPMYAGKIIADYEFDSIPQMVSLRSNIFFANEPDPSKSAIVEKINLTISSSDLKTVVKKIVTTTAAKMDLTEADIIVSGGRGMKCPENYKILEELAELLGGVVGASRAAVDAGWRPHSDQIGQTGKTVSPKLYIACGISGAIQHLAGIRSSKCIVAINKDATAPIFEKADYGIVGDLFEVIPQLTEELKKVIEK
ncbi:MAG: electron transfer flavoprotein subunit alpha/FixB family protein [bacterium]